MRCNRGLGQCDMCSPEYSQHPTHYLPFCTLWEPAANDYDFFSSPAGLEFPRNPNQPPMALFICSS